MVRWVFAALVAVMIAPSAASVLRLRYFEHFQKEVTTTDNYLINQPENGENDNEAGVYIYDLDNDLEDQMVFLRLDDDPTEEINNLRALVDRQTATNFHDLNHWSIPGVGLAVKIVDYFAEMMNVWPVTRAIVSMIMYIACCLLALMLHDAKTRGDKNVSLITSGLVVISIYILVDAILKIRIFFIYLKRRPQSTRLTRRFHETFARAAAIFRPPTADLAIDTENCVICTNGIKENVTVLTCGHSFHRICVLRWAETPDGGTCPICRTEFTL